MPLYEYKCHSCGKTFEVIQKFSDSPVTIHEECGGPVERLLSAPAFHLKGSGWYATDYAKGGVNSPKPGDPKSGDAKGEGSSEKSENAANSSDKSSEKTSDKAASGAGSTGADSKSGDSKSSTSETKPVTKSDSGSSSAESK